MTLWLAYHRYYKMKYSSIALLRSKRNMKVNQSGYDVVSLKLVLGHFPGRLIGTVSLENFTAAQGTNADSFANWIVGWLLVCKRCRILVG